MIHIIDDYYFTTDGVQFTLLKKIKEQSEQNKKKRVNKIFGYYTNIEHMLTSLSLIYTAEKVGNDDMEIEEYIKIFKNINERLAGLNLCGGAEK